MIKLPWYILFRFLQGSSKNKEPQVEKPVVNESNEVAVGLRSYASNSEVGHRIRCRSKKCSKNSKNPIYFLQLHKENCVCRFVIL